MSNDIQITKLERKHFFNGDSNGKSIIFCNILILLILSTFLYVQFHYNPNGFDYITPITYIGIIIPSIIICYLLYRFMRFNPTDWLMMVWFGFRSDGFKHIHSFTFTKMNSYVIINDNVYFFESCVDIPYNKFRGKYGMMFCEELDVHFTIADEQLRHKRKHNILKSDNGIDFPSEHKYSPRLMNADEICFKLEK